ncbi:class C sortase [Lactococcus lactis]|uniref:Sortase (Surface protein transpeptidase) n=1 Tax=Lactococcus lactis subsp. lactis TaxID=1360 RepID=A0A2N5WGD1_LACLL|nr:class C sortase [Lactococcus lactis]MDT2857881.1 class C sortase [Lactococcus lactis]PLW61292.2 Sortase (surface protein transpeptidase) [Lactococcus lactis subsp. lactis]
MKRKNTSSIKTERATLALKVVMILLFFSGIVTFFYPFLASAVNSFHDQSVIEKFQRDYALLNENQKKERMDEIANENKKLLEDNKLTNIPGMGLIEDPFESSLENIQNVEKSYFRKHMLGAIFIPTINVSLPLYDETNDVLLDNGATLLQGTSYPIGGPSTHSVITGHSGLPDKRIFTDLNKLKKGDMFYIEILDEKLAYRIETFQTVLPTQLNSLKIIDNQDLVTLITCTPYMVNTHRLLVTGVRVPYSDNKIEKQKNGTTNYLNFRMIFLSLLFLILFVISLYKIFRIVIYYKSTKRLYELEFRVQKNKTSLAGVPYYLSKNKIDYKNGNVEGIDFRISGTDGKVNFGRKLGGRYYIYTISDRSHPLFLADIMSLKGDAFTVRVKKHRLFMDKKNSSHYSIRNGE